jgi:hypothetical protein
MRRFSAATLLWLLPAAAVPAADITLRDFARRAQYVEVQLSPDGEHLAVATPREDETGVAIIRLSDMKLVAGGRGGAKVHAQGLWWANPETVVLSLAVGFGPLEQPKPVGRLMMLDLKSSELKPLGRGHRAYVLEDSRFLRLVSPLRGVRDDILTAGHNRQDRDPVETLERLKLPVDRASGVARAPLPGTFQFVTDDDGALYFGFGTDPATHASRTYAWQQKSATWKELGKAEPGRTIAPLRLSKDRRIVYSATRAGTDKLCLSAYREETGEPETIACHADADLKQALFSADGTEPIAAVFEAGRPEVAWVNRAHADGVTVASLAKSFKDQVVLPVSWTDDGRKLLFLAYSDRNPGDYFLYDRGTK